MVAYPVWFTVRVQVHVFYTLRSIPYYRAFVPGLRLRTRCCAIWLLPYLYRCGSRVTLRYSSSTSCLPRFRAAPIYYPTFTVRWFAALPDCILPLRHLRSRTYLLPSFMPSVTVPVAVRRGYGLPLTLWTLHTLVCYRGLALHFWTRVYTTAPYALRFIPRYVYYGYPC